MLATYDVVSLSWVPSNKFASFLHIQFIDWFGLDDVDLINHIYNRFVKELL